MLLPRGMLSLVLICIVALQASMLFARTPPARVDVGFCTERRDYGRFRILSPSPCWQEGFLLRVGNSCESREQAGEPSIALAPPPVMTHIAETCCDSQTPRTHASKKWVGGRIRSCLVLRPLVRACSPLASTECAHTRSVICHGIGGHAQRQLRVWRRSRLLAGELIVDTLSFYAPYILLLILSSASLHSSLSLPACLLSLEIIE